jgi:peptide/nickel transport system permease protein
MVKKRVRLFRRASVMQDTETISLNETNLLEIDSQFNLSRSERVSIRIKRNLKALFGFTIITLVLVMAILSPFIAPHDPYVQSLENRLKPPAWVDGGSPNHLLGTDSLGRDVLSRLIYGSRVSIIVGFSAVFLSGTIGIILGMLAGFYPRILGAVIMRIVDMFLSMPWVLVALAFMAALGSGLANLIIVLVLVRWAQYARLVNGVVLQIKEQEFIEAARARAVSPLKIMIKQILPNTLPPILVMATLELAFTILMESGLSFLGLGVKPPTPTWGLMCSEGREYITNAWWLTTFSGLAIVLTVLGVNLLGDWVRDRIDPRLKT